jgi:uncharacterized damage-inducible protein DinB
MSEIERITDQLRRAFEGDAWHGPSVREVLEGVTPEMAARKVLPDAHTIWEIVLHITAWENFVRRRLEGETVKGPTGAEDWPVVHDTSPAAWRRTIDALVEKHNQLIQAISKMSEEKLNETVPETDFSYYVLLHGVVQHDLYHSGQIVLLKKAKA